MISNFVCRAKPKSMKKYLEKNHNGKWEYIPYGIWVCDDKRYGHYVHSCGCDDDCDCPIRFYIYSENSEPELVGTFLRKRGGRNGRNIIKR